MTLLALAFSLRVPDRVRIQASSCSFWQKEGQWKNSTDDAVFATWTQECEAISVSDITVSGFGRTDEKQIALLPTIRIRNEATDDIEVIFTETLTSVILSNVFLAQYDFKLSDDTNVGQTTEMNLFDRQITVKDNTGFVVAQASQSFTNTIYQTICVSDGYWDVQFMSANSTLNRWWILSMITVKAVRDMSRGSDGKPQRSLCQYTYLAIILCSVLIPVGVGAAIVGGYCYCRKRGLGFCEGLKQIKVTCCGK